jgi:starch-binding outer membrane protein, SusD/RagB family
MKTMKRKYFTYLALTASLVATGISCSDSFFDQPPIGAYSEAALANSKGVEGMLIGTYSMLDGSYFEDWGNNYFVQNGGASNWVWGSIRGGDAYKGTEPTDFVDLNSIETHSVQISNGVLGNKWTACYDGIARANQTLRSLKLAKDITPANAARIEGEARFLRAHFHFEALKVFGVVPYVSEEIGGDALKATTNDHMIWSEIKQDFQFAYDNLPGTQIAKGRVNKWAAGSFLAKVLIYQGQWAAAKTILDNVITSGTTAAGTPYSLQPRYGDIFRVASESGSTESVFAYEASALDGTIGNGNYENTLNQPHGGTSKTNCCGFFQPAQNLVNSYKVDGAGLPMPTTYNSVDLLSDEGLLSSAAFTPDATTPLDPRLDHTVGRRGIPFLDWGLHPGNDWIRLVSNGGPYSPKKNVPALSELGATAGVIDWGFASTSQNVQIMRYADVLLMSAEVEAELGNLGPAQTRINAVRARAANPAGFVAGASANYQIGLYPAFATQAAAITAVRFERKLEFGMEGHRMFDLVRWSSLGSKTALPLDLVAYINNEYLAKEKLKRSHLSTANFTPKYRFVPLPDYVVTQMTIGAVKNVDQSTDWGGTRTFSIED